VAQGTLKPLYQRLVSALTAMRNCERSENTEWLERWRDDLETMMRQAPSGGGFDAGTTLDMDVSGERRLVFNTSFHHMTEHGYYDGWTAHTVVVTPAFDGFNLKVTGRDRNEIKDYIADAFDTFLKQESST
jgi:hypothetical protein